MGTADGSHPEWEGTRGCGDMRINWSHDDCGLMGWDPLRFALLFGLFSPTVFHPMFVCKRLTEVCLVEGGCGSAVGGTRIRPRQGQRSVQDGF